MGGVDGLRVVLITHTGGGAKRDVSSRMGISVEDLRQGAHREAGGVTNG